MEKIKLLHAISDTNIGGAGVLLLTLLRRLDKEEFAPRVLLPRGAALTERILALGVPVTEVAFGADASFRVRDVLRLVPVIRAAAPDILHTHGFFSARVAGRLCGVPKILATRHCAEPAGRLARLPRAYGIPYSLFTDKTVATAAYAAEDLLRRGLAPDKIALIRNGCEPKRRIADAEKIALRRRLKIPEDAFILGMNARLERVKGQDLLLRALVRVRGAGVNAYALFLGCGTQETEYRRLANELGMAEYTRFTGFLGDVAPYLNLFDLNLNCSRGTETSCLAISEAMSLGIPTLATDYGGNPELVRDGCNGYLFKTDDEAALTDGILRLYRDEKERKKLRDGARRLGNERFSAENMANMYTKLYKSMLSTEKG